MEKSEKVTRNHKTTFIYFAVKKSKKRRKNLTEIFIEMYSFVGNPLNS